MVTVHPMPAPSSSDTRALSAADRFHGAAADGDGVLVVLVAPSDSRAHGAAGRSHRAAVDGDDACSRSVSATDTGCVGTACRGYVPAIDGDGAAATIRVASDARALIILALRDEGTRSLGLPVDGQGVALVYGDALGRGEPTAV